MFTYIYIEGIGSRAKDQELGIFEHTYVHLFFKNLEHRKEYDK